MNKELTQEVLKELLHYDQQSGIFTWKERDIKYFSHCQQPEGRWQWWNNKFSGVIAGNIFTEKGGVIYNQIGISIAGKRQNYRSVRLAWLYMKGEFPSEKVLKKDGDGTNDAWENLSLDLGDKNCKKNKLTHDLVKKLLSYDEYNGVLTWNYRDLSFFSHCKDPSRSKKLWNKKFATRIAGTISPKSNVKNNEYYVVKISLKRFIKSYLCHRLIWFYMTGKWPEGEIDHKNQNGLDNTWSNLQDVSKSVNQKNASMRKDNTSGFTGVDWSKQSKKWKVRVQVDNKRISGGLFTKLNDAIQKRQEMNIEYGFSKNHGRKK